MKKALGVACVGLLGILCSLHAAERSYDPAARATPAVTASRQLSLHHVSLGMSQGDVEALAGVVRAGDGVYVRELTCTQDEGHVQLISVSNHKVDTVTEIGYRPARKSADDLSKPDYVEADASLLWSQAKSLKHTQGQMTEARKMTWLANDQQLNYVEEKTAEGSHDLVISQLGDGSQNEQAARETFVKVLGGAQKTALPALTSCLKNTTWTVSKVRTESDLDDSLSIGAPSPEFASRSTPLRKGTISMKEVLPKLFGDMVSPIDSPAALTERLERTGMKAQAKTHGPDETVTVEHPRLLGLLTFGTNGTAQFRFSKGKLVGFRVALERKIPGGVPAARAEQMRNLALAEFDSPNSESLSDTHGMKLHELNWVSVEGAVFSERSAVYRVPGGPSGGYGDTVFDWVP